MTKAYTYSQFALDVIALLNGEKVSADKDTIAEKAQALYNAQVKKAEYNASHPRKSTAKGPSEATKAVAENLKKVLNQTPKTTAEINAELGTTYTALNVANALRFVDNVKSTKVIRETVNSKGLKAQREYTAYYLD